MDFIGLIIFAVIGVVALSGIRIVRQQTVALVETFGKYSRTMQPGLNYVIPIIQRVVMEMDLRVIEFRDEVEVKTVDNMFVKMPVAIMAQIIPTRASDAYYQLQNPDKQIMTWVLNTLRSTTSGMALTALYEDRQTIEEAVQNALSSRMQEYGYSIVSILVDQPSVSLSVQESFNRVVASAREREAATQEAEAKRIRIVGEATAEAESQELRAAGLAKARAILSSSLAEAVSLAKGKGIDEKDIMHLLLETNRLDTIRYSSEHGKLVLVDLRSDSGVKPVLPLPLEVGSPPAPGIDHVIA